MQKELNRICEQFVENRKRIERAFPLSARQMHCMCALLLGLDDCDADLSAIRKGKRLLRRHTPPLSTFRGFGMTPIATKLAVRDNGKEWLEIAKANLRILKKAGFPPTDYLCLAAMLMIRRHEDAEEIAQKTREIYQNMRHAHRVLTANEDVCFAVLYAMHTNPEESLQITEIAFEKLQDAFGTINPVQMASQVIGLLGGDAGEEAIKTAWLYRRLREGGVKTKTHTELCMLAFLAACGAADEQTVQNILEVIQYLKHKKGYSAFVLGRHQRLLFASCLTAISVLNSGKDLPDYRCRRDALQCAMILTVLLSVVQSIAATGV